MKTTLGVLLALGGAFVQADPSIQFEAPKEWTKETPSSNMRKAQYKVPDKEKKASDADFVLYYFGKNSGTIDANVKRWAGQMGQKEAKTEAIEGKCKVTLVDLTGTYTERADAEPLALARMLAAVVETADGPWYFKLVGPAPTVGGWKEEMVRLLKEAHP
jgi:hypothetical protein